MATMAQIDLQIGKLQMQRDVLLQQVNNIEKQEVVLRKQLTTGNDAQKTAINTKLSQLSQQKTKITGNINVQAEDAAVAVGSGAAVDSTSVGGNPNAPMGADGEMSTSSIGGKFAPKMFSQIGKKREINSKVMKFVDDLGNNRSVHETN